MRKNYLPKLFALALLGGVAAGVYSRPAGAFAVFAVDEAPAVTVELTDCPDADGVVRGKAKIATGETATEIEMIGYVTDAAELSHFDLKGETIETRGRRDDGNQRTGGRLVEAVAYTETAYTITYRLGGERDASGGFANAFYADAEVSYTTKKVRNLVYAPASCGATRVAQSRQEFLQKSEAAGIGRVTVFVSADDRDGSLQLFAPNAAGASLTEQIYDSSCPKEDRANSFTRPGEPFEWQFEGMLVEFVNESAGSGRLVGAKTIDNGDGTTATVKWNLTSDCR